MSIQITSTAFTNGSDIPTKYTCDGEDISPPLKWNSVPEGTKSIALIADDPDAPSGTWVHWVLYALPSEVTELPEGVPTSESTSVGALQGTNDFGRLGLRRALSTTRPAPPLLLQALRAFQGG